LGSFQFVASFSALHHLTDTNNIRIFRQIYDALEEGGWFFLIDAMSMHFDDDVFNLGRKRSQMRRQKRFKAASIDIEEDWRVREMDAQVDKDSPEKDRISSLSSQIAWLKEAGFRSVDHIWHFWMEHFIICRK
jgi:SAM-dependent methyltransferase